MKTADDGCLDSVYQGDNAELRRLWFEAIDDDRLPVDADEVFDRLERKYLEMVRKSNGKDNYRDSPLRAE